MNKNRFVTLALFACGIAAITTPASRHMAQSHAGGPYKTAVNVQVSPLARSLRPNYPFSVIPGGVYTLAELRSALERDPGLREHYAVFELDKVRLVKLLEDRYAFVSYRRDGQFYWTKHKLRIPRGEVLLTDGVHYAKTRCGNRLSELPSQPVRESDNTEAVLSPPPLELNGLSGLTFLPSSEDTVSTIVAPIVSQPEVTPDVVPGSFVPALPDEVVSQVFGTEDSSGREGSNSGGFGGSPGAHASLLKIEAPVTLGPAVPEPSGLLLLGSALVFVSRYRLRTKGGGNRSRL